VNDRIDVAIAAAADGVHLASTSVLIADARSLLGPSGLIGISTHTLEDVSAATAEGADFAVFGPVYDPLSKGAYGPPKGLATLMEAVKVANRMPVYALGGIDQSRTADIAGLEPDSRPSGVAVIGAVLGATAPGAAVREILHALRRL
jgi:thiamine-phosphate pyrophosphorylase